MDVIHEAVQKAQPLFVTFDVTTGNPRVILSPVQLYDPIIAAFSDALRCSFGYERVYTQRKNHGHQG
ncbi:MAG: hypothetical protein Fur0041_01600 [Bacteroidia bacterium]